MANWTKHMDQEMPAMIFSLYGSILAPESEFGNIINNNGCYKPFSKCKRTTTNKLQIQASIVTTNTNTYKVTASQKRCKGTYRYVGIALCAFSVSYPSTYLQA